MRVLGRWLGCGALLLAGIALSGCNDVGGSPAVATIGSSTISQDDYLSMLEIGPGARGMTAGQTAMNQLIENKLIIQQAEKDGVAPTKADLEAVMNDFRTRPEFKQDKERTGLSDDQYIDLVVEPRLALAGLMAKMAGIKDTDVQKYFDQNKAQLREPEQVRARVLAFPDRKKAQEALNLVGKSSAEAIAKTLLGDTTPSAQVVSLRKQGSPYPQPVVDAAFKAAKGGNTGIIEAAPAMTFMQPNQPAPSKQFYVVFVEDKVPAREPSLSNPLIRTQVRQLLAQQKMGQGLSPTAFEDMIRNIRAEAVKNNQINVIRPTVKSIEKGPPAVAPDAGMMGAPQ